MTRGRWVPWVAVASAALIMWVVLFLMAPKANAETTYPPTPPPTTPSTPTADTGFQGQHDLLAAGVLGGIGVVVLGAAAVGRKRAKEFQG